MTAVEFHQTDNELIDRIADYHSCLAQRPLRIQEKLQPVFYSIAASGLAGPHVRRS